MIDSLLKPVPDPNSDKDVLSREALMKCLEWSKYKLEQIIIRELLSRLHTRHCMMKLDVDMMTLASLCIHSSTSSWMGQILEARRILRVNIQTLTTTRWQFAQLTWLHEIVNQFILFCEGFTRKAEEV